MNRGQEEILRVIQAQNRDRTILKIENMMSAIDFEIEETGVYLQNGGRLNRKELCRRAGVGESTLKNKTHAETARHVREWLEKRNYKPPLKNANEAIIGKSNEVNTYNLQALANDINITKIQNEDLRIRITELERQKTEMMTVIKKLKTPRPKI